LAYGASLRHPPPPLGYGTEIAAKATPMSCTHPRVPQPRTVSKQYSRGCLTRRRPMNRLNHRTAHISSPSSALDDVSRAGPHWSFAFCSRTVSSPPLTRSPEAFSSHPRPQNTSLARSGEYTWVVLGSQPGELVTLGWHVRRQGRAMTDTKQPGVDAG
jgi:hypothetical protein